ncbi:hypothetical protein [Nocardioides dongkuii]|uniref:hypothetical protein n=1 Tax=Nocardioides dongkuii TaxID=2760089 RepID=UPI0018779C02|nr:hypothetical protein [Nocardioides dongkuii]
MPVTDHGVSTMFLAENNSWAQSVAHRTWRWIAQTPAWSSWMDTYKRPAEVHVIVSFEDRDAQRMLVRGDTLFAYVPMSYVRAAAEARTMPRFMAELYGQIHRRWAEKRGWPPPPEIPPDIAKLMPSRFP